MIGDTIGYYQVHEKIGACGMDVMCRARALVMELVQGPTMAGCIRPGAVPLEEDLARQIADFSDILLCVFAHSLLSRNNGVYDAMRP